MLTIFPVQTALQYSKIGVQTWTLQADAWLLRAQQPLPEAMIASGKTWFKLLKQLLLTQIGKSSVGGGPRNATAPNVARTYAGSGK
jgi:hypothetical protein